MLKKKSGRDKHATFEGDTKDAKIYQVLILLCTSAVHENDNTRKIMKMITKTIADHVDVMRSENVPIFLRNMNINRESVFVIRYKGKNLQIKSGFQALVMEPARRTKYNNDMIVFLC